MKKLLGSTIAILMALAISGCGKDNGGGTQIVPPPSNCPPGYVQNGNVCTSGNGTTIPINPSGTVQYYDYNRSFDSWGYNSASGDMTITNAAAFKTFLREAMGVCDRNIWGWQAGLASCDNWVSGSFQLSFAVNSSLKPTVQFKAYPAPSFFQLYGSFGIDAGGAAFNPLVLSQNNTLSLINNSQGFEIRAQGSYWNGGGLRLIQIQVAKGTLNDGFFTYDLYYPMNNVATKFASGKLKRY